MYRDHKLQGGEHGGACQELDIQDAKRGEDKRGRWRVIKKDQRVHQKVFFRFLMSVQCIFLRLVSFNCFILQVLMFARSRSQRGKMMFLGHILFHQLPPQ